MTQFIGGFFELGLDEPKDIAHSLWDEWTQNAHQILSFYNARSALYYLLDTLKSPRLWLPSYICADIMDAPRKSETPVSLYPSDPMNGVDLDFLEQHLQSGDVAVFVNYYGCPPTSAFKDFIAQSAYVTWIEDRCQSVEGDLASATGDWLLYSARKITGVSDGALLLATKHNKQNLLPVTYELDDPEHYDIHLKPLKARYEDREGVSNEAWYKLYRESEDAMEAALRPMSARSLAHLKTLDYRAIKSRRIKNAAALIKGLDTLDIQTLLTAAVPFCLPILVPDAPTLSRKLAQHGIFCARHWPALASLKAEWPEAWDLSQKLLSLPCDQRYTVENMKKIIRVLKSIL